MDAITGYALDDPPLTQLKLDAFASLKPIVYTLPVSSLAERTFHPIALSNPNDMRPKLSKNIDEVCYPFIYETSLKCDYEIHTDAMCRQLGGILSLIPPTLPDLKQELEHLQPIIYHLNGSIRGKCSVSEEDHQWLLECYTRRRDAVADCLSGFVLPRGHAPVPELNAAGSAAKVAIRLMLRLQDEEDIAIPERLYRFCNVLCNYYFTLTLVINRHRMEKEIPFESKSYRVRRTKK